MRAIDVHLHPSTPPMEKTLGKYRAEMLKYYRRTTPTRSDEEMAADYRAMDIVGIPVAFDAETATGEPPCTNDYVASLTKNFPDVFIAAFASVDPLKGEVAAVEAVRAVKELGMMGVKFAPIIQGFALNDRRFYPLWETIQGLGVPVQVHMGTTGLGAGSPGGLGIKLEYGRAIPYLDDFAADFPGLQIIACHPGWPWHDELIAVLLHKANVVSELSGWMPKYFPPTLVHEIGGRLQDKVMFGSDYPALSPQRWLDEFADMFPAPVQDKVFRDNARRILGLRV